MGVHSLYAIDTFADWMLTEEYAESHGTTLEQLLDSLGVSNIEDAYEVLEAMFKEENSDYSETEDYTESVNNNGGFYIARYEASYENGNVVSKVSTSTRTRNSIALENGMLWNCISQEEALPKVNNMYTSSEFTSSLLTGAAWDRTLSWLEETGVVTIFEIVGDSTTWGNYDDDTFSNTEDLINTGEYDETEKNHIYDLAGNLEEWTTEAYNIGTRVTRGRLLSTFWF